MKVYRILFIQLAVVIFSMNLSISVEAQSGNNYVGDDWIIVSDNSWRHSRAGAIEYYKDYIPEIIPDYFILGTLGGYTGRFHYCSEKDQLDYYYSDEDSLLCSLKEYVKDKFGINIEVKKNEGGLTYTHSAEWAEKINTYFNEEGTLKNDIFKTDKEIYSFLSGAYYRRGYKVLDSIYKIQSEDEKVIYFLLQKAGCDKIFYNKYRYYIPGSVVFYFEVSVLLEKYFDSIESKYIQERNTRFRPRQKDKEIAESILLF